ncbi:HAD family hydrolase [Pedobacter glucosidilyticus]|uniref:HAD family hydrolase n=1 Tax=Pedobacter glucosidilyticus TaxID=1122941 RepID=UPI0026E99B75|nr:HAD family phosphatase [Pedobacter glucosidilyticus]
MKAVKTIIFDYGNVIFNIDFKRTQQAFIDLGIQNIEEFFAHKAHDPLFDEFEKGNITAAEWRDGIRRKAKQPALTDKQIDDAWNTLLLGVPEGNHDLLLKIKAQYPTFLLSNNNEIHYEWIMKYLKADFGLTDNSSFFVKDYYSHLLRMRKPNADIFEYVLDTHHLNPEETLFIDDSPQHLKTAQELGLQTYLMTAPDNLQLYFSRNGLLRNL